MLAYSVLSLKVLIQLNNKRVIVHISAYVYFVCINNNRIVKTKLKMFLQRYLNF